MYTTRRGGDNVDKQRKLSKAKIAANNRYNAKTYDYITIAVPKGNKARIDAAAAEAGQSRNAYIVGAILDKMGG